MSPTTPSLRRSIIDIWGSSFRVSWGGHFYDDEGDTYDDPVFLDYTWGPDFRASALTESVKAANAIVVSRTVRCQRNRKPDDGKYQTPSIPC